MQKTDVRSKWAGWHQLPELTEKEQADYKSKEYHKVRNSAHVQAMEALINESISVDPTEVNGVVLYLTPEDQGAPYPGYALITEDEDGDILVQAIVFVGSSLEDPYQFLGLTKEELVKKRFAHTPPRTLL